MTTRVHVDCHAGWPVKVTTQTMKKGKGKEEVWTDEAEVVVPAKQLADFYVYDGKRLIVEEMKEEKNG